MALHLKKVQDQVIVITGASSGIGLATARLAAKRGAKVMLSSRNAAELRRISEEIQKEGGEADYLEADVANAEAMERLAQATLKKFGRIDTWVNNAAVSIYGKLSEVHLEEKKRLFDVNFWGMVNGCRAALPQIKKHGGAIINVGSVLSDRAIPMQGMYCASKAAMKAYTDSLRMELEADKIPVSVTLVKPATIDTPYTEHALNRMGAQARNVGPYYSPELVARTILECAQTPVRDVFVGGAGKLVSLMDKFMPRVTDRIMERSMIKGQQEKGEPVDAQSRKGNLYRPAHEEGQERPEKRHFVLNSSLYTAASLHPKRTALTVLGLGALLTGGIWALRPGNRFT